MVRRYRFMALLAGATLIGAAWWSPPRPTPGPPSAAQASAAPGAPGAASYFDLARKDCVGTAAGRGSKVWYTVAGGVLSDVYEPTIDNTDVSTLQYVVTDGSTFTDLQTRDMTYTVAADPSGMACTVTSTDAKHGFQLITTYITDPASDTVLMQTRLQDAPGSTANLKSLHLYARLDAHVNGNGGGGSQNAGANSGVVDTSTGAPVPVIFSTNTVTNAANRDYAVPTYMALAASTAIPAASVGYAGTASDGLTQLDASHALTALQLGPDGHVVATENVTPSRGNSVTLALGFGRTQAQSISVAEGSLSNPFGQTSARYRHGWTVYDAGLRPPAASFPGLTASQAASLDSHYYLSANVLKASEDKTFPGAIVASLASPWGQSVPAGVNAQGTSALLLRLLPRGVRPRPVRGVHRPAGRRGHRHGPGGDPVPVRPPAARRRLDAAQLAAQRQAGPRHRRDPAGRGRLPILMAHQAGLGGDATLYQDHIRPAADFLVSQRAVVRGGALGGADRLLAVHDRRRDRRADRRRRPSPPATATPRGRSCTRPPPTTSSA